MQSPTRYMRVVADYMRLPDRFRRTVTYVTIHIPHLGTVLIVADGFTPLVQSNPLVTTAQVAVPLRA